MSRQVLTDRTLKALKPAGAGKRYDVWDAVVPGLGVRVGDKANARGKAAQIGFVLAARFPGSANPTRRKLGGYGELTLQEAREKARHWLDRIERGIDPAGEGVRAAQAKREQTFGAVAEAFIARHLKNQRRGADSAREIRRDLVPVWKDKPIDEITRRDVVAVIEAIVDRGAPYQAHAVFGYIRVIFNWAIDRGKYGLEASPCDRVKPARLIGPKKPRTRVLDDDELFAYMRAADRLGYPFGEFYKLIPMTGARLREASNARWREFDLERGLWTIPTGRFKSEAVHIIPLAPEALDLLASLPRFNQGDYLFSTTFGEKPVSGFSKAKARLDARMQRTLEALARRRGRQASSLEPFITHDVRRTVRTRLSSLKVDEVVAELLIGHGKKGLARVYDQWAYLDERREALERWNSELARIA